MAKKINMLGYTSGKLTVIKEAQANNGAYWECQCECGKTIIVRGSTLRDPKRAPQSCGCERIRKLVEYNRQNNVRDIANQRFGSLIAIKPTEQRNSSKSIIWQCLCDCGKEVYVSSGDLCSGNTKSCGCQRYKSYGEKAIKQLLEIHNIPYIQEYKFSDLYFEETGCQARFDFYVNNEYLIEFDGIQHFVEGKGKYDNAIKFKLTQEHDTIKNVYCLNNNIPLIRIPYTALERLNINMLIPETSPYLIIA